jgi:hypothetical protein
MEVFFDSEQEYELDVYLRRLLHIRSWNRGARQVYRETTVILTYTREFTCEVPDEVVIAALEQAIDDWGYDDDTPESEQAMGVSDMLQRLNDGGHLVNEIESNYSPEMGPDEFEEDFYTVQELKDELNS